MGKKSCWYLWGCIHDPQITVWEQQRRHIFPTLLAARGSRAKLWHCEVCVGSGWVNMQHLGGNSFLSPFTLPFYCQALRNGAPSNTKKARQCRGRSAGSYDWSSVPSTKQWQRSGLVRPAWYWAVVRDQSRDIFRLNKGFLYFVTRFTFINSMVNTFSLHYWILQASWDRVLQKTMSELFHWKKN